MGEIKLYSLQNVCDIVGILIKNNYKCTVITKYKKFPRETDIDYFLVSYSEGYGR